MRIVTQTGRKARIEEASQPYSTEVSKKVYVGNLSFSTTWTDLKDHMKLFGGHIIRAEIMTHPDGSSKGFGIVEFGTVAEAATAIERLQDSELKGRKLSLRPDRDAVPHQKAQAPAGPAHDDTITLRVTNLPDDYTWKTLKDLMKTVGPVKRADVTQQGIDPPYGTVEYVFSRDALTAKGRFDGSRVDGNIIRIEQVKGSGGGGVGGALSNSRTFSNNTHSHHIATNSTHSSCTNLYVGGLAWEVQWQELKDHFKRIGKVVRADVAGTEEGAGGRSKGYGLVQYERAEDAARAIAELNDSMLMGRKIHVREDRDSK